jgi:uncharacterized protein YgfB (UPF0149 family)
MVSPRPESLPEYSDLAATLQRCSIAHSPAEVHGFALGLYVGEVTEPLKAWHKELYSALDPSDVLAGECRVALDGLFAVVFAADRAAPLQLTLLLPQGLSVDSARLAAVRDWCQGFLFGFGLGGELLAHRLSAEARELLRDFAEFTRLDTEGVENSPENQSALIEIEEYLRVGVMLIRDELSSDRGPDEPK